MGRLIRVNDLQSMWLFCDVKIFDLGDSLSDVACHYSGCGFNIPIDDPVRQAFVSSMSCHIFDGKSYLVLRVW